MMSRRSTTLQSTLLPSKRDLATGLASILSNYPQVRALVKVWPHLSADAKATSVTMTC